MARSYLQAGQYERLSRIRRWQIHAGSNRFCFNGRCITGRNLFGAIILLCLISLTTLIWLVFELPSLLKEFNNSILIIALLLLFYTYIYFFRSMCTDPGIIQRPSSIECLITKTRLNLNRMTSDHLNNLTFDVKVNNAIVKCKYCITCNMIRPPRSSHCAICSNCIYIFDHHCPFLSTCIGMRNYRFFILFLICLLQTELFFFATSFSKILIYYKDRSFSQSIIPLIPSYFMVILTSSSALYTCNLLGYHTMISTHALTTREDDKGIFMAENPFNMHSSFLNLAGRLCTSLPPSSYGADRSIKENI